MATGASPPRRKLAAILMVDVSGFSRMMERDEERTTALIREGGPPWWLVLGGIVVIAVGLGQMRTPGRRRPD